MIKLQIVIHQIVQVQVMAAHTSWAMPLLKGG